MTFDDDKGQLTISPRINSTIVEIPRVPVVRPYVPIPTIRNYTATYNTGMSAAYVGLYTIVSLMGTEAITIGALFAVGILYFKNRSGDSETTDSNKKKLKAKKETEFEVN